ncbi:unnamed protein product [Mytilus edulis]|uniref:CCHC-type domain-containing protein n=1 Tax=Mytilus edulis TaxID=6550 RepID=A0A8S3RV34_MYTED|nr:unnamed protein product [Mytilus edulis]
MASAKRFFSTLSSRLRNFGPEDKYVEQKSSTPYSNQVYEFAGDEIDVTKINKQNTNLPLKSEKRNTNIRTDNTKLDTSLSRMNAHSQDSNTHIPTLDHKYERVTNPDSVQRDSLFSQNKECRETPYVCPKISHETDRNITNGNPTCSMSEFNLRDFFESPHNNDSRGLENGNFELLTEQLVDSHDNFNGTVFKLTEQTRPLQRENTVGWRYDVNVKDHVTGDTLQFDRIRDKSSTQRKGIRELSHNLEPVRMNLNSRLMDQSQTNLSNARNYNEQTCCTDGTNNRTVAGACTQTEFERPDNFKREITKITKWLRGHNFNKGTPILRIIPLIHMENQTIPRVERESVIHNRQGNNTLRNKFKYENSPVDYECQSNHLNPYHTENTDRGPFESNYSNHITPHRHEPNFSENRNTSFQSQNTNEQMRNSRNSQHNQLTGVNAHETNTNYGTHLGAKAEHFSVPGQRQIPRKQKDPDTYDGKHVLSSERETAFRCEFRNRRRKREESVADYGYALKRLATRAFPSIPLGVRESLIIEQYISGLGDAELKRHVQFSHPNTLDKAISLALEYEAFEGSQILPRKPKSEETSSVYSLTKTEDMNTSSTTSDNMISKLLEGFNEMQNSMKKILQSNKDKNEQPRFRGTPRKKPFQCFHCKEEGHMKKDCPSLNNPYRDNSYTRQSLNNPYLDNSQARSQSFNNPYHDNSHTPRNTGNESHQDTLNYKGLG